MNEGVAIVIEVDEARARRRLEIGYVDRLTDSVDEALAWAREAANAGTALSIALVGNAAEIEPQLVIRGERFDAVTDQTSAHDALNGYVPAGLSVAGAASLRESDPEDYVRRSMSSMADHVRAMLALRAAGAVTFDYGNNLRAQAAGCRCAERLRLPGIRAGVHPTVVCRRQGSVPMGGAVR